MTTAIAAPLTIAEQEREKENQLKEAVSGMEIIPVVDAESYEQASARIKDIIALEKRVGEYWDPLVEGANKVWKALVAKRKEFLEPLGDLKQKQNSQRSIWFDEQERIRKAEELKAQEAARKQAEDEALANAERLEKEGDKEGAAAALEEPVPVPQVIVKSNVPKTSLPPPRKNYSATVTDIKALAKAVLAGTVPVQAIQGNDVFLNAQARMLKETMKWPGVTVNVR